MPTYSYNGQCYLTPLQAGQAYCADHYPLQYARTQNQQAIYSCISAAQSGTDGSTLKLQTMDVGTAASTTAGLSIQQIRFSICSTANKYIGTPGFGENVAASSQITGTVTAVGYVTTTGVVNATGTVLVTPEPFTQEKAIAYLAVFASLLTFGAVLYGAKQIKNLFNTGRSES